MIISFTAIAQFFSSSRKKNISNVENHFKNIARTFCIEACTELCDKFSYLMCKKFSKITHKISMI